MSKIKDITEIRVLEIECRKLARAVSQISHKAAYSCADMKSAAELSDKLRNIFRSDGLILYNKLRGLRNLIKNFKDQISRILDNPREHYDDLQRLLKTIEAHISQRKSEENIMAGELLHQEVNLWQECLLLERRIVCWTEEENNKFNDKDKTTQAVQRKTKNPCWEGLTGDLPKEVVAYQHFLDATGGRLGRWTDEEHTVFLRLYKKCHNRRRNPKERPTDLHLLTDITMETTKPSQCNVEADENIQEADNEINQFHRHVSSIIATKTPEEVAEHEKWWIQLQELEDAKRSAIQQWKEAKAIRTIPTNGDINESLPNSVTKTKRLITPAQLEAQKAALHKWRTEREQEDRNATMANQEAIANVKRAEQEQLRRRQEKLRYKVARFRTSKLAEQSMVTRCLAEQTELERLARQRQINESADRIKQRNQSLLQEHLSRKEAPRKAKEDRNARLQKAANQLHVSAERDRYRLTQWTKGWHSRLTACEDSAPVFTGIGSQTIPHRMTPNWRRGL
ncbi:hypothetical protein EG68_08882 [Paragonimus skrjabini miyazakii]|uniref:Coiled-coil domain-containing protein 112 n=1 Tax=Paragonimus skrjabini miyazakii TaxID=59628 RepID=A0A8S9YB70_9TREM|nr:hypothetical protein EG68_08882 [Paragonimus skrjabini miyazakii]